jgi:hypothetical protein
MAEKESFLTKLIWFFIKPKVQRDIAKIKNSDEWQKNEKERLNAESEIIKALRDLEHSQKNAIEAANEAGVNYRPGMTYDEIMALQPDLNEKIKNYLDSKK